MAPFVGLPITAPPSRARQLAARALCPASPANKRHAHTAQRPSRPAAPAETPIRAIPMRFKIAVSRVQNAVRYVRATSEDDAYDNAVIESFWGRMQTELLNRRRWSTRVELTNAIFEYFEVFHNRRRRHGALDMMTPIEFEKLHPTRIHVAWFSEPDSTKLGLYQRVRESGSGSGSCESGPVEPGDKVFH